MGLSENLFNTKLKEIYKSHSLSHTHTLSFGKRKINKSCLRQEKRKTVSKKKNHWHRSCAVYEEGKWRNG